VNVDIGFVNEFHVAILALVQKNPAWAGFSSKTVSASGSFNTDVLTLRKPFVFKLDFTVRQGKQGMIAADSDVVAGVEAGSPLAYDNITGQHGFTTVAFHTKVLGV
jgi:hypothetical protein